MGYKRLWSPTEELGKFCVEMALGRWDDVIRKETGGMKEGDGGRLKKEGEGGDGKGFEKLVGGGVVVGNVGWRRVALG